MKALTIVALLLPSTLGACINVKDTSVSLDGHVHDVEGIDYQLRRVMTGSSEGVTVREMFGLDPSQELTKEARAVDRILQGDTQYGLDLLLALESEVPGDYSTAANIGTAYELLGDNAKALQWIREGMNRKSTSHFGTEWLHALILEAKIDTAAHPGVVPIHHLLDVPERLTKETLITVGGKSYSSDAVRTALFHQLNERLFFVKPKDPYVADLLYSYAVIEANLGTINSALGLLQLAREYGYADEAVLSKHEKRYQFALKMVTFKWWVTVILAILVSGAFLKYCIGNLWRLCHG